jgi:hypothetical protein
MYFGNPRLIMSSVSRKSDLTLLAALLCTFVHADPPPAPAPIGGSASTASQPPSEAHDRNLPQVAVEARRDVERRAYAFVKALTHSGRFYGESLAIWRAPLCFAVAGLPKPQGEFMLERLSTDADSAGVPLAREPCQPNVFVVLSREPDSLLKGLEARHAFGEGQPAQIQRFIHPAKIPVVRIWRNANTVDPNGAPLNAIGAACGGAAASGLDSGLSFMKSDIPTNCEAFGSRPRFDALVAFSSVIVVVDTRLTSDATFGQLADYVAVIALADIDQEVDFGDVPTILRLFVELPSTAPPGLTIWDRAFLSALYHTDQSSRSQRSEIVSTIARDVSR